MVVPRGPRLLPSAPFTLYVCFVIKGSLGSNLSKHAGNCGTYIKQGYHLAVVDFNWEVSCIFADTEFDFYYFMFPRWSFRV